MNGIEIKKKGEMPSLEINLNTMKIYGTNGCNNFRGLVHATSEKTIVFKGLTFSKKECLNMDFALQFNQALEKTAGYKYEELHLTFYDKDGKELITFMKVD